MPVFVVRYSANEYDIYKGNIVNCAYDSVKLRIIHEICQGLGIGLDAFFASPLFDENNLEP